MQTEVRTGLPFFDLMLAFQGAMVTPFLTAGSASRSTALVPHRGATQEHVVPLAEETLHVEARKVSGQTTRVHRYVVESPVERRIALHNERVVVERRRPVAMSADGDVLVEKTVEATEMHEVPVVWKGVRVREEVVLRLEGTERTETVRETLRRDEVDIEQPSRALTVAQPGQVGTPQANGEAKTVIHREQAGASVQAGVETKAAGHGETGSNPVQAETEAKVKGNRQGG